MEKSEKSRDRRSRDSDNFDMSHINWFSGRKVRGSSSGRTYKTVYTPGKGYRRISYRKNYQTVRLQPYKRGMNLYQAREVEEWKNVDTTFTDVALNATDGFSVPRLISGVAQGVATNERVGRKIVFKSLHLRFHLGTAVGTNQFFCPIRICVIYDRQTNGVAPVLANIFAGAGGRFDDPLNLANSDRFVVITDQIYEAQAGGTNSSTWGKMYKKFALESVYGGTGATTADINTGGFYIMLATTGGAAAPTINMNVRLRYTDC